MPMPRSRAAAQRNVRLAGLYAALLSLPAAAQAADGARILIDPNVRVSREGSAVVMEAPVSAAVDDPRLLYAGGEVLSPGRAFFHSEARIYVSRDAGGTWSSLPLQDVAVEGSWDNAIVGGRGGVAYFVTHGYKQGLLVYRTADGGETWKSAKLPGSWDREYVAVDTTDGRFSGRLYVAGNLSGRLAVAYSKDGGQTFTVNQTGLPAEAGAIGGVDILTGKSVGGPVVSLEAAPSPVILSDGTLVVPSRRYPANRTEGPIARSIGVVVSKDGGDTFSPYREIANPLWPNGVQLSKAVYAGANIGAAGGMTLAVSPGGVHRDRLYAAWSDVRRDAGADYEVLKFAWSDDAGASWSKPVQLGDRSVLDRRRASQLVPLVAVNRDGVVGVAWYDNRNAPVGTFEAPRAPGYDLYFVASVDGGKTFLPEQRITEVTSFLATGENTRPRANMLAADRTITFSNAYSLRQTGGDYAQMAVDAAGRFHPLWGDTREGAGWQLYTSTIHVLPPAPGGAPKAAVDPSKCDLNGAVKVLSEEMSWNAEAGEVLVNLRIQNTSQQPLTAPVAVRIHNDPPMASAMSGQDESYAKIWPKVGVAAGKSDPFTAQATQVLPFDAARPLMPDSVSDKLSWRLRINHPWMFYSVGTDIRLSAPECAAGKEGSPG